MNRVLLGLTDWKLIFTKPEIPGAHKFDGSQMNAFARASVHM